MAKIVYGVSGEGSGHSSRAREMAGHLRDGGHDVRLASYDRGYRNLKDDFPVLEIEGLTIASEDNRVSMVDTFVENLKRLPEGHRTLQQLRRELFKQFQPDCVITDFEPMTAYLAQHYDLPLISLDNQHRMRYLKYECPPELQFDRRVTKNVIRAMVPRPDVSLVTAFRGGKLKNERTFIFPPIVRRAVLDLQPTRGDQILVYVTSGFESLLEILQTFARESFLVYGYDREDHEGPLQYRPFSKTGFLSDLAAAKAVIATAGFTLISESLHLHKPYLALPMQGQFEQQLNGYQLAEMGYGKNAPEVTAETVGDFLYRLPDYDNNLLEYVASDNAEITSKLDELLANDCALLRDFHTHRR
ncbi:MAG: hypothetical protein KDB23_20660 [Planctomycetales bacterium]|nr:hypothetical protein [Planctomycetales bacterium]